MNIDEYQQLKKRVDKLKEKRSRAEGALDQLMGRLKDELGVTTIKAAKSVLEELEEDVEKANEAYADAHREFVEEWGERLEV